MNGFRQDGFGYMDMTVGDGRRCSAANAYLRPAMRRQNLTVRTHALATRVLFEGRRAVGVCYQRHGATHEVRVRREVLLCAGPINTPQLLKLSGVGPGAGAGRRSASRWCTTCPGWARTCRITSSFTSRWRAANR